MSTVLVIGASRGIGLEFVGQYREAGARVIATARDDQGLARLRELGAEPLRIDVANPASVSGLAWQLDGEKIDVALYVAGVFPQGNALSPPTREAFDQAMHVDLLGPMQAMPQVATARQAAQGRFAFISSAMAQIAGVSDSRGWLYRASKAALNMAVAAAQHDYPGAILVALSPGWVRTDMGGASAPLTPEDSVNAMRHTIARLTPRDGGRFIDHEGRPFEGW